MIARRTIGASDNKALLGGMRAKNNGRYNGNGREWRTPPEVFLPLHEEFHFTLDPCTTPDNPLGLPKFYTEADNGLEQSWAGERVFMNPPYGREIAAWTRKARNETIRGTLVVGLLPASTDLRWWHEDVVGYARVRYLRGRVRFLTDGPYRASGFFASVVVVWGSCELWQERPGGWRKLVRARWSGDNLSGDVSEGAPMAEWDCVCGERHHDIFDRAPWRK